MPQANEQSSWRLKEMQIQLMPSYFPRQWNWTVYPFMIKFATHIMGDANLATQYCLQKKKKKKTPHTQKKPKNQNTMERKLEKFGRNEEIFPSSIQTLYFRDLSNLFTASTLTQQKWHRVHGARVIILASNRGCPRSLGNTGHKGEWVKNSCQRNWDFFTLGEKSKTKINAPPGTMKNLNNFIPVFIQYIIRCRN